MSPEEMLSLNFPVPHVPKNPVLGWSSFSRAAVADAPTGFGDIPSVLSLPNKRYVTSARVAIALALQRLGVGHGDRVLVPAYHCLSMVEPIVFSGAEPCFFPLTPKLEVPLDALERYDLTNVRALLVTHYFGFPQAMRSICAFAKAHGIPVIEDCAHAVFGLADERPIGSWGDYAAVSLMKFFPVYDGGCLASYSHPLDDLRLQRPSRRFEAKALLNSIERGLFYRRFPGMQTAAETTLMVKDAMWRGFKRMRAGRGHGAVRLPGPGRVRGRQRTRPGLARPSHLVRVAAARRAPADRPHHRPASRELPAPARGAERPARRPAVVRRPAGRRRALRVPAARAASGPRVPAPQDRRRSAVPLGAACGTTKRPATDPLSARYATEIFQLPCHQELTDADLGWIIESVQAAFRDAEAA